MPVVGILVILVRIRVHCLLRLAEILLHVALRLINATLGMHARIIECIADIALDLPDGFLHCALCFVGGALFLEITHGTYPQLNRLYVPTKASGMPVLQKGLVSLPYDKLVSNEHRISFACYRTNFSGAEMPNYRMRQLRKTKSCMLRLTLFVTLASLATACTGVPDAFGTNPAQAKANADGLFGAFVRRFTNVYRAPRYERARQQLLRYALTPSEIYSDTSIWTLNGPDNYRTLFGDATFTDGRYVFVNTVTEDPVKELGEGRHIMRLRKLTGSDYSWFTGVDFAAGTITANDFANVITQWIAASEGRSEATLRAGYRSAFPRTTAALGQLYSIDSLVSMPGPYGTNKLYAVIHINPDGIRSSYPGYAAFMKKYADKVRLKFTLVDSQGAKWLDVTSRDGYITLNLRSRNGHFVPFDGAPRPIPDTLVMNVDLTAKIKVFTIGVEHLTGEWVNLHSEHERGWAVRFTREPGWVLPPVVGYLIKSPLRRPFEGDGTSFRLTVRDQPGSQTLMSRRGTTTVRESAILRFIGKLGGGAMGEFVSGAEEDENKFNATVFSAMKADVDAGIGGK